MDYKSQQADFAYPRNEAARTNSRATLLYFGSISKLAEQKTAILSFIIKFVRTYMPAKV